MENDVENNHLSGAAAGSGLGMWLGEIPDAGIEEKAQLAGDIAEGNAKVSAHLAGTVGLAMLPGGAQVAAGIGAGANAAIQYAANGEVNYTDTLIAGWVGAFTTHTKIAGTVAWNTVGGAASSAIKGDDPLTGAIVSGASSSLGYGLGRIIQKPLEKIINPIWKNYEWVDVGIGVSKPLPLNPSPGIAGNITDSLTSETINSKTTKKIEAEQ
ncbi:hypothetical protein ABK905_25320 [Acerihabitans sp. KWT182]|uniref:Adhesin n=1 Tax=Acerihabitans sp. KWT182 TaxID=3157919 RepID=A0AAU7Q9E6_9GAMM